MLILGILAAIAIPSFFNQRDKARDADAKAAVSTAETSMETYATDNNGAYTGGTAAALQNIESTLNDAALAFRPWPRTATPSAYLGHRKHVRHLARCQRHHVPDVRDRRRRGLSRRRNLGLVGSGG